MNKKLFFSVISLFISVQPFFAANRYWVSVVASNWNNTANWSATNGGSGGSSVPSVTDNVTFNSNGTGNCLVDISPTINAIVITSSFLGMIDVNGNTLNVAGTANNDFLGGTINDGLGTGVLTINSTARTTFSGTIFGTIVNTTSGRIKLNGSTFNNTVSITKTGSGSDYGTGGNIFNMPVSITNNGIAKLYLARSNPDIFNGDVTITVGGTGRIYMADIATGNEFNGNIFLNYITNQNIYIGNSSGTSTLANTKTISIIGSGALGTGDLLLKEFTQLGATAQGLSLNGTGVLTIGPNSTFNANLVTTSPGLYIRESVFNGLVNLDKTGVSGNTCYGGNTYNGLTTIINSGSGYLRLAGTLGNTYNSTVTFSSTGTNLIDVSRVGNSTFNDHIIVNSTGTSTGIRFGDNGGTATLSATKTITIGGGGFSTGQLRLRNFNQIGNTTQNLTLTGAANIYIQDSNWGGDVTFLGSMLKTKGTLYQRTAHLEKTGANNDVIAGGNTFNMTVDFVNSSLASVLIGDNTFNTYNANVNLTNSGTSRMFFALNGTGHIITGNLTVNNTATGASNYISIAHKIGAHLTVNGSTTLNNTGSATGNSIYLGNSGDITFNGTVNLNNIGSGANSEIYCNHSIGSSNTYNQNITLVSTNGNGIRFGENGGSSILAPTKTITIGNGGFTTGELWFRNFKQLGSTAQSLTLTGTAILRFREGNVFNGDLTTTSPRLYTEGGTFNGITSLTKNGNTSDYSRGGCTFNGATTITNSSTATFAMSSSATYVDDFNADVTFVRAGTGSLHIAYKGVNTFAGDININGNSVIIFGKVGGITQFDGNVAQSLNDILGGTSAIPDFYNLQMNNSTDELTLNMPARIRNTLTLTNGNINTTATNLLTIVNNATVAAVSNASYISGPVKKIGNDAFTFPVGKNGFYAPISITSPTDTSHSFTAEYFNAPPMSAPYDTTMKDVSIEHLSRSEFWILNRINGTSNVNVSLSWDFARSGGVTHLSELLIARWNGSMWKDHGNGGTTGSTTSGVITTSSAVSSFSPFTLASSTSNNPLPIELISFNAVLENDIVNLLWQTASEINNDYFTLEKSKDALNWSPFAEQAGAGNSNSLLNYANIDVDPFEGISYYRLKQTDFDGSFDYSDIVTVNTSKQGMITVYPNPVKDLLTIVNMENNHSINVYSTNGQLVYNGNTNIINTSKWSNGIYQIIIANANGDLVDKIRIVK